LGSPRHIAIDDGFCRRRATGSRGLAVCPVVASVRARRLALGRDVADPALCGYQLAASVPRADPGPLRSARGPAYHHFGGSCVARPVLGCADVARNRGRNEQRPRGVTIRNRLVFDGFGVGAPRHGCTGGAQRQPASRPADAASGITDRWVAVPLGGRTVTSGTRQVFQAPGPQGVRYEAASDPDGQTAFADVHGPGSDFVVQTVPDIGAREPSEPAPANVTLDPAPITVAREVEGAPTMSVAQVGDHDDEHQEDHQDDDQKDEALVERIYERLRWRLRDELRTERERYGELTDRGW
jgi:hypothetical protein